MKRAIALCGGGSRGAYEMGVWTALREREIDYQLVTGTSIGSLNGALMVQGDYETTNELWHTLTVDMVMEDGINLEASIEAMLNQKDNLMPFLRKYIHHKGADITPLRELLGRVIDEERLRVSEVDFGLVTVAFPSLKSLELTKADIPQGKMKDYLLASASCFPAFPMCKIDGKTYIDGGYYDNLPIRFALRMGADEIIAVDLNSTATHPQDQNNPCVTYIKPSWDLGSILLFDPAVMSRNITLGYNDAQKTFGWYFGDRYTFCQYGAEEEFKAASAKLARTIAWVEAELSSGGRNALIKSSITPVSDYLAEFTGGRKRTSFDCLTRSLECCAELLGIDHLKVYSVLGLASLLRAELVPEEEGEAALLRRLRTAKLPTDVLSAMNLVDQRALLRAAYHCLKRANSMEEELRFLSSTLPKELAAVLGVFTLLETHEIKGETKV